jgi:putative FmdB family regulatory protein
MPIYEYNCKRCHKHFDELVRGDEKVQCPDCGCEQVDRRMSVCGFKSSSKFTASAGSNCGGCGAYSCAGCSSK